LWGVTMCQKLDSLMDEYRENALSRDPANRARAGRLIVEARAHAAACAECREERRPTRTGWRLMTLPPLPPKPRGVRTKPRKTSTELTQLEG
jgi:hypothetical protein